MSDGAAILAYSRNFLSCLRPCLTKARDAKGADFLIGNTSVGSAIV